jgi:hypothetical protein
MDEQPRDQPAVKVERRKATRFPVVVPVEVKWQQANGTSVQETAQALEVNALGGLLDIKSYPAVGSELELTNLVSREALRARVVGTRVSKRGQLLGVAVQLLTPSETFWGANFQLRKSSAELAKIEQAIKSGGVDARILRDFRDAVDYVRKTAWAVQEWQERQLQKHDPQTVLALITTERIRRLTALSRAIMTDLGLQEVTRETAGIGELFRAVQELYHRLGDLLREA